MSLRNLAPVSSRSRIFLLGAAGEQEENGLGASASGPARTLTQNVPLGSRVVSQKVNFLGQGNKGGSSRLPLGEERANILLLACCYQEGSNKHGKTTLSLAPLALSHEDHLRSSNKHGKTTLSLAPLALSHEEHL